MQWTPVPIAKGRKSQTKTWPVQVIGYLTPSLSGESVSLPRTTKWRRLLTDNSEENQTEEASDMSPHVR